MPISELGARMSAHELAVIWPAFYALKAQQRRRAEHEAAIADQKVGPR